MTTLCAPLLLLLPLAAPPSPTVVVDKLKDGTGFVHVRVPSARAGQDVSVRYVVRAGGADDPPGRAGLAHLLEHLVFHGTYEEGEGVVFERAWGAGAELNAFTSADFTVYHLDVPLPAFNSLVPGFLSMVTNPALPFSQLEREKGVVGAEDDDRPDVMSVGYALDQLLFPAANGGVTVIGTKKTREPITLEEIEAFYATHYVPGNATVVVVGDISVEAARAAIEQGLRSPPALSAPALPENETPNLGSQAKSLAWLTTTGHAILVDGGKPGACEAAAELMVMRLRKKVIAEEGLIADVFGVCHRQRGHDFVLLAVATASPESSQLPTWMAELEEARTAPSPREKELVTRRVKLLRELAAARPDYLAWQLTIAAARDDKPLDKAVDEVIHPPPLSWSELPKLLEMIADPSRRAEVHFSRFEG